MRRTDRSYLFVSILFSLFFSSAYGAESAQVLGLGEQSSFPVEPGIRFSVGNSEVIQVKSTQLAEGRSLLLVKGKGQGYSDLILLGEAGVRRVLSFRVVSKRQAALAQDGKGLFTAPGGLQLQPNGDGWLARGSANSLEDWNVVQAMEAQGKGRIQTLVRLHPLERLKAEGRIRKVLLEAQLEEIAVKGAGNSVVIYGDAANAGDKELAETLARQVLRDVRSQIKVPFEKGGQLRFHARILEVLRSGASSLGLQWPGEMASALQLSKAISKLNFSADVALKMLERRGQARVLSQPELLLNEKGVAELRVGGEIPIPVRTKNMAHVEWKAYGLSMRLELPGVSKQTARTHITVEISSLDPSNGFDGIPALRVSRMDTQVDMQIGKAVLLSGLMENRESRSLSLLPGLGDIPILGELFRSRDFQENRSELVILLEASV